MAPPERPAASPVVSPPPASPESERSAIAESPFLPLLSFAATLATVVLIVGLTVALFFNPIWIAFEQDRAGVATITGYAPAEVRSATSSILADLVIGPPDFAVAVAGRAVLDPAERLHLVDVRTVLLPLAALLAVALLVVGAIVAANRRSAWAWQAVARGSGVLVVVGLAVGIAVTFFFDTAFLLFHLVFFPQGNFTFDPHTERLTQLFPQQFWTETSIGVASVGLAIATAVTLIARRLARRMA